MKSVTMKDIAQAMNTSIVSVSKALAGKSGVSEELREKIILKAQEMGYMYASIPTGNVKVQGNIGILVADRFFNDSSFYSSMYRALLLECNDLGFPVCLKLYRLKTKPAAIYLI